MEPRHRAPLPEFCDAANVSFGEAAPQHPVTLWMSGNWPKAQTLEGLRCQMILLWEECGPEFVYGNSANAAERHCPDLRLKRQILLSVEHLTHAASWQPINPKFLSVKQF